VQAAGLVVGNYHQRRLAIPGALWLIMTASTANAVARLVIHQRSIELKHKKAFSLMHTILAAVFRLEPDTLIPLTN
jgi:hypothetical protein